ncbi:MAG TPA: glycosyltransferase family 4 protein, partial [Pirellulaceae bacterium]
SPVGPTTSRRRVCCIYGNAPGFSGQRFASEILIDGLRQRGWDVRVIKTPVKNRLEDRSWLERIGHWIALGVQFLVAWCRCAVAAIGFDLLHVNLGQTPFSMLRDGFPLLLRGIPGLRRQQRAIISLHGHVFMQWNFHTWEARFLRTLMRSASYVTILGPKQKDRLSQLGIPAEKIVVMDNTCLLSPISDQDCRTKHARSVDEPLCVLYLSNLIESKGYPEFVEAIRLMAQRSGREYRVVLCGKFVRDAESERFTSVAAAADWLRERMREIHHRPGIRMRWVDGAVGEAKADLFRNAHIYVLPSRYRVEAQPIAILEALASGCAVVTTPVGEIPSMLSANAAVFVPEPTDEALATVLEELADDPERRVDLALRGLQEFRLRYAYDRHLDRWETLIGSLDTSSHSSITG